MPIINLGKVRISFEGEWTAGQNYEAMSLITYNSEAFMAVSDVPPSTIPPTEAPTQWVKVGSKGDTGPKGDKGDPGLEGSAGAVGARGVQGDTGPAGPQGVKGDTGAQGPKGDKGDKGDIGSQGQQGIQGVKGDPGNKGEIGLQGEIGPQGPQGATGATGSQGPKGNTGSTGAQGPQGAKGDTGPMPSLSSSVTSTSTTTAANSYAVQQAYAKGSAAATVTQLCINANVYTAPIPCNTSGKLGCFTVAGAGVGDALYAPSGGTWAYFAFRVNTSNKTPISLGPHAGTVAGGGLAVNANSAWATKGFFWRIT